MKECLNFKQSESFSHLFPIISAYNRRLDFAAPWTVPPLAIVRVGSGLLRHWVEPEERSTPIFHGTFWTHGRTSCDLSIGRSGLSGLYEFYNCALCGEVVTLCTLRKNPISATCTRDNIISVIIRDSSQ